MASFEGEQEKHWKSAQSGVSLGLDLIAAARSQLRLLADVDSHPLNLYHGPALQRAIRRYENCWLPLLAKHGHYLSTGFPLIPPLDCAWVWHCHRLNPAQYIKDCETYYGKLLDSCNTFADTDSKIVAHTQQIWDAEFPDEKYEIHLDKASNNKDDLPKKITYDLQAAVERQSSFFYQVSRPHMGEESFLKVALQRYKGFLYLLKLSGLKVFLVPTYDIDLMWHSHQASPGVYQQDTVKLLGKVLNHDDTDSDRSEGKKLDTGFKRTQAFWQHNFGLSYERAGAMYGGEAPISCQLFPSAQSRRSSMKKCATLTSGPGVPGVQARKTMQVFLAVQKVRNLHTSDESIVAVRLLFANKCSSLDLETSWIKGENNSQWNDFWALQCEEATGGIRLELRSKDLKCCNLVTKSSLIGWVDISWATLLNSSTLSCDGWVPLLMKSKLAHDQKPTSLRICVSITPPVVAPSLLRIEPSVRSNRKKDRLYKLVFDCRNKKSLIVKLSGPQAFESFLPSSIEVHQICDTDTTDTGALSVGLLGSAECLGPDDKDPAMMVWSLFDGDMQLAIFSSSTQDCQPYVQIKNVSRDSVRLLHGRRCQYNVAGTTKADELGFMTLVRQSPVARVAKATALFNWKSGAMEVSPEENGILVVLLCTIIAVSLDSARFPTTLDKMKRSLQNMRRATRRDEWCSVILNGQGSVCAQGLLRFCPWYSLSADLWTSMFYDLGSSCFGAWTKHVSCGAGGCGGCGAANSLKCNGGRGGGCGGCGAGGCMNSAKNSLKCNGGRGGGCGGCGAGGCMNSAKNSLKCNGGQGGGCGGCGAGGCMNSDQCVNHVQGGGCGACGAGGCGNNLKDGSSGGQGGSCGGCGNSVYSGVGPPQGGGCGGCGAGGCGNNIKQAVAKGLKGGGCGGCGSGGCGNGLNRASKLAQGGGCGVCGAGGCNSVSQASNIAKGGGCGGCGSGGCGNGATTV